MRRERFDAGRTTTTTNGRHEPEAKDTAASARRKGFFARARGASGVRMGWVDKAQLGRMEG